MHRRVRTALSLSMSALVFSGYMALGTTLEYGRTVLLIPVFIFMLMPMAEWLDARYPIYRKVTTLLTLCYTLSIPIVLMRYALFPTVVALVIYIQSYKLLHVKEDRDYHHIFLMSFFLLVTACVLSPDASIALPILLYLASSVWAFFTLQVHMEASKVAQGFEADIVPLNVRHAVRYSGPLEALCGFRGSRFVLGDYVVVHPDDVGVLRSDSRASKQACLGAAA